MHYSGLVEYLWYGTAPRGPMQVLEWHSAVSLGLHSVHILGYVSPEAMFRVISVFKCGAAVPKVSECTTVRLMFEEEIAKSFDSMSRSFPIYKAPLKFLPIAILHFWIIYSSFGFYSPWIPKFQDQFFDLPNWKITTQTSQTPSYCIPTTKQGSREKPM